MSTDNKANSATKRSKLDAFSLSFEYNCTLKDERAKIKHRTDFSK